MASFAPFARSAGFLSPRLTRTVKMTFSRTLISVFAPAFAEEDPGGATEADAGAEAGADAGTEAEAEAAAGAADAGAAGTSWANADPATASDAHVTRTANTTFKRW